MKRVVLLCSALLLSGALALAQNEKVVTPQAVNPEVSAADSLQTGVNVVGKPSSVFSSGRWYFGLGGYLDYTRAYGLDLCIAPNLSYKVSNTLFVGGQFSYTYYWNQSRMGITPYLRWHIIPLGKAISLFTTVYAPCEFWKDYLHLGVRAKPGLAIRLAPGTYVMGSYGSFGYSYIRSPHTTKGWLLDTSIDSINIGFLFSL